jgi:hypothetical protein
LVASSTKRRVASSAISFGSTDGCAEKVEVGQGERRWQRREAGQAGPAPLVDGVDLDGQESFEERLVGEFGLGRLIQERG